MEIYTGIIFGLLCCMCIFQEGEEKTSALVGTLVHLPIFGRIFGWW